VSSTPRRAQPEAASRAATSLLASTTSARLAPSLAVAHDCFWRYQIEELGAADRSVPGDDDLRAEPADRFERALPVLEIGVADEADRSRALDHAAAEQDAARGEEHDDVVG
jgi:hypothetical protein